jgi:hypothetical protein
MFLMGTLSSFHATIYLLKFFIYSVRATNSGKVVNLDYYNANSLKTLYIYFGTSMIFLSTDGPNMSAFYLVARSFLKVPIERERVKFDIKIDNFI